MPRHVILASEEDVAFEVDVGARQTRRVGFVVVEAAAYFPLAALGRLLTGVGGYRCVQHQKRLGRHVGPRKTVVCAFFALTTLMAWEFPTGQRTSNLLIPDILCDPVRKCFSIRIS